MSTAGVLRVRTPSGRVVASGRFRHAQVVGWLGDAKIRLDGGNGIYGVSAATAKRVALPAAFRQYTLVTRGPRVAALLYPPSFTPGNVVRLVVGRAGGAVRDVATYPVCADLAPVSDLQLFGSSGVAYATSCVAPAADVYSVSPDGSDLQRLTTSPYDDAQPAVSPDGTTIAYVRKDNEVHCPGCTETLWAMSADGTGAHSFPNSSSDDLPYDDDPSFSPDGKTILFVRSGPDATGLFTVPVQGGAVRDLKVSGSGAVWGPSEIAYDAWPSGKPSTMSPDGTRRAIARGAGSGGAAAWSPDGRLAYLQTDAQGRLSILLSAAGKRIALPHLTSVTIGGLAWSPDGTRLAFVATDASGESDVWMIRADGTQLVRVTHGLGAVTSVAWR
jgi:dipeptidyl aminopeptidase/acylaminoacyl peptidase